ncbi:glycine betaine ABC transporter substrate-binding protein [Desulfohalobium retbaense]|uniref:Substrate-binding region of ABC-type glycine betaine transport system n=1 Tax=Desulfohalobium retbaense (strain ATCC 49708 / DSM 5692 / JCM 16813 / HR100) TaxID=485915 RepID=C8X221_DESRD|nr:glycine betaine ABC transporter substrate-binding protein [Desulfohalobium retbaense]ACV68344.1 Substrate-binding region of ABC-type glycine betaine transport system [Desulfohalobium retbaense DSM 5692]
MLKLRNLSVCSLVLTLLVVAGVARTSSAGHETPVTLAYVEWSSEVASTNLVKAVIQEKLDRPCRIVAMSADEMWRAVAQGSVDGMVSAWLPGTQSEYLQRYEGQVIDLGPNLEGTRIGLVVPKVTTGRQTAGSGLENEPYIPVTSIAELPEYADKFDGKIIGIDPEAGIMHRTEEALRAYGLHNYTLVSGSEVAMTAELADAIRKRQWVVVTGWEPHWMFARWRLAFLDDPKEVFGGREAIHTVVRSDLREDMPDVYRFLDNFQWTSEDMEQLMLWIEERKGVYPYESARRWIRYHKDQVASWLP